MDEVKASPETGGGQDRDPILDLLKGAGCLLMIVAHSALKLQNYEQFTFHGGLAPVMFFSAAAVTASFQARRYRLRGVLLTYLFLFLLGFSFNRITDVGFLGELEMDMLQIIAVGSAIIVLLERRYRPGAGVYLGLAILAFGAKFAIQAILNGYSLPSVTNMLVPPGVFPLFPWLFLFFGGLVAHRVPNLWNLALFALWAGTAFGIHALGVPLLIKGKWDMTIGYFLVCNLLLSGSVFMLRLVPWFRRPRGLGWLLFLGRNSLLFLYVHFPLALFLKEDYNIRTLPLIRAYPFLFWLVILAGTVALMLLLMRLARWRPLASLFERLSTWIVLTLLVFGVGVFIPNDDVVYLIEVGLGILMSLYFHRLSVLLKKRAASASARSSDGVSTEAGRDRPLPSVR